MYVLVIFRQGGPVQLKIGLNGVCVNNGKALTQGDTFPTLCEKCAVSKRVLIDFLCFY